MSDTPRTDAHLLQLAKPLTGWASYPDTGVIVPAEMARELERELAIMTADRKGLMEINQQHRATIAAETARLDWMAQSYDDVGGETPDAYMKATRTFERVFASARKSGKANSIAVREAIDAARAAIRAATGGSAT